MNIETGIIQCEFMDAMGFNKKIETWQDQFKKRQRILQRKLPISIKANRLMLNMKEIEENSKENWSSINSISEKSNQNDKILDFEEKKYQQKIFIQLESLIRGDNSIFSIYDPFKPSKTSRDKNTNQVPNILILDFDQQSKINSYNQIIQKELICIQDLMNHPILQNPAFSLFRDYVKHNQAAIFDQKFYYSNWKQNNCLNDHNYEIEFQKFKMEIDFLLEHAIRNDDSSKDKFNKINALTYQLDQSCNKFINQEIASKESSIVKIFIKTQRDLAAKDLYKRYVFNK